MLLQLFLWKKLLKINKFGCAIAFVNFKMLYYLILIQQLLAKIKFLKLNQ